jgi:hypothetical protein
MRFRHLHHSRELGNQATTKVTTRGWMPSRKLPLEKRIRMRAKRGTMRGLQGASKVFNGKARKGCEKE